MTVSDTHTSNLIRPGNGKRRLIRIKKAESGRISRIGADKRLVPISGWRCRRRCIGWPALFGRESVYLAQQQDGAGDEQRSVPAV